MIEKLVVAFFQKIEENEGIIKPNGKSRFFIEELLEKKYIEKDPKASASLNDPFLKDVMAIYLGYIDYNDFVNDNQPKKDITLQPTKPNKKRKNWRKIIGFTSIPLLGLLYIPYQNSIKNTSNCIVWTGYKYEKTTCDNYQAIANNEEDINIEVFMKIDINNETPFFKEGKAIVWYGKNNHDVVEYFNSRGKHPETNKELKKITRIFLNKQNLLRE